MTATPPNAAAPDPVLARRRLYARLVSAAQRAGYVSLLVAIVAFVAGFAAGFPPAAVTITIVGLVGSCLLLPPAIVFGYAIKAAEREDRAAGR